ncbi:hypothetical protein JOB18_001488 [Solea senegalensis]|uniref:Uncharacterized protein n=1 Tax=Solea senegalensis TaxID=28829 RepID=A0AAV6SYB9_SOLSE|nr:hypothetical protein JOB18_001488 [Solea senegalensis]
MKKRPAHSKSYLDCMNLLEGREQTFKQEVCETRWAAKLKDLDVSMETEMAVRENIWRRRVQELETERQVDKKRLQKMEEKRRMTETKANELICKLQIQDLNQPPQVEGGACECCQSELEQTVDDLETAESRW